MSLFDLPIEKLYEMMEANAESRMDTVERLDQLDIERATIIAVIAQKSIPQPEPITKEVTVEVEKPCAVCERKKRGQVDLFKFEA